MSNFKKRLDYLANLKNCEYKEAVMLFVNYEETEEEVLARTNLTGDEFIIFIRWVRPNS